MASGSAQSLPVVSYRPDVETGDRLEALFTEAYETLKESVVCVRYPDELRNRRAPADWAGYGQAILGQNRGLFSQLKEACIVYALLVAKADSHWTLMYIGQAKAEGARQRVRSHLVWRNKLTKSGRYTGSKFDEVVAAVSSRPRLDIGFSAVSIEPGSLRHFVEDRLIEKCLPVWNIHGSTPPRYGSTRLDGMWPRTAQLATTS